MTHLEQLLKSVEENLGEDSFITPTEISILVEIIRKQDECMVCKCGTDAVYPDTDCHVCEISKEIEELAKKALGE